MIPLPAGLFSRVSSGAGLPFGRLSLLDMINFRLNNFVWALRLLAQETRLAFDRAETNPQEIVDAGGPQRERFDGNFSHIVRQCEEMVLEGACNRIERIATSLRTDSRYSYFNLATDLNVLMESIEDDIRYQNFYHYPRHKSLPLRLLPTEWAATIAKFPSAKEEIEAGVDCYALDHNTAAVFHMMRVAECGLRALAREREVSFPKHPLEWADWQNLIEGIEKSVRALGVTMPRGPAKDAALAFHSGAIGQFHAFKDKYRNMVMHVRRSYTELEALSAMTQVRDFMNGLSAKIGEKTRGPIRRWP